MTIISSIFSQTNNNWFIHVICDGTPTGLLDKIIEYFEYSDKINFTFLDKRYNDWGHTPRNYGLEKSREEWVVMTGEDNYYTPVFVDNFLSVVTEGTNFVYCDTLHNWVDNQYIYLNSVLTHGGIDIGSFMCRSKFAKELKLDTTFPQSDSHFMLEYLKKFPGDIKYIKKGLYVHN